MLKMVFDLSRDLQIYDDSWRINLQSSLKRYKAIFLIIQNIKTFSTVLAILESGRHLWINKWIFILVLTENRWHGYTKQLLFLFYRSMWRYHLKMCLMKFLPYLKLLGRILLVIRIPLECMAFDISE